MRQATALNRVHLIKNGRLEEANFQEPTVVSAVYFQLVYLGQFSEKDCISALCPLIAR